MIGLLEVAALAGTLLSALAWVLVVLVSPLPWRRPARDPARDTMAARAWLYAPLWVPLVLVGAAFTPGVVGAVTAMGDHCVLHGGVHHHHLCLAHPPHAAGHPLTWLLPLAVLAPALTIVVLGARRVWLEWRLAATLVATSRPSPLGRDVRLVDSDRPLALTVGWRRPRILLSSGFVGRVSARTLDVVLAHERAHVARRDTWFALFDRFAASLLPRAVAGRLTERIVLGRELACDAIAAAEVGSDVTVARALTEVARLRMSVPATGVSVASGALEARVVHLLRSGGPGRRRSWLAAGVVMALAAAGAGPVHTALERIVSYLLH